MTSAIRFLAIALGLALLPPPTARAAALETATGPVDEASVLDVGIALFELGVDDDVRLEADSRDVWRANPDIRRSEAVYIPFQLKSTLESTGFWGAVRVLPSPDDAVDVLVTGEIVKATPRELILQVEFQDAQGRTWKRARYRDVLRDDPFPELPEGAPLPEPHQAMYDDIANDLLASARRLDPGEPERIREVAELRFAATLSPEIFGDYLEEDRRQRLEVVRLPATDDPMVERMRRIRERDQAVIDAINEHYATFCEDMEAPYWEWRRFSYDEFMGWKKVRRQARMRSILGGLLILGGVATQSGGVADAAVLGGAAMMKSGWDKRRQAKIHVEALGELAASFKSEVEPLVVEVEGRTLRLEGTAQAKYEQWRDLLQEIFAEETGAPAAAEDRGPDDADATTDADRAPAGW